MRKRLATARLYFIVGPRDRVPPAELVRAAIVGGAAVVQYRDKHSQDAEFAAAARIVGEVCREFGVPFLVNDRAHLMEDCRAHGVHLGEADATPEEVRERFGSDCLIGLSTHDRTEAAGANARGADYIGLGPMFQTGTKTLTRKPGGADLLRTIAGATELPVFPIGGISETNLPALIAAGATRVAVSSAIADARDPTAAARKIRSLLPPL
ncbi:MAG: thiamine phosphate synthase [Planctomycetota bacterium]